MPGIVIAGTHSGCGKTTVTLGIMAALGKKGLRVQPFKTGPDFIDAGLHRLAAGRPSRNLDQWMCGPGYVSDCFRRYAADSDIAVIEGVMGMYDGEFSSAALARLLRVPVLLVVDAYGMAESAGAMVQGFAEFGVRSAECGANSGNMNVAGVIFNRVGSESHYQRLKNSVRDVPVLGYLPRELDFEIPHRHLGLATAEENPLAGEKIARLAETVLKHIDIERVIRSADCRELFPPLQGEGQGGDGFPDKAARQKLYPHPHPSPLPGGEGARKIRIAVAYDKAFSFYYEDNLDLLKEAGAELIRFSPLVDRTIPDRADAVYIGGGYPELHADALSRNLSMLGSIHAWAGVGKALYAECGGLMYLSKGIRNFDDVFFPMAGVFPFETRMLRKPKLAYREIVLKEDCILGTGGERIRGHEFHYSELVDGTQMMDEGPSIKAFEGRLRTRDEGPRTRIYSLRDKSGLAVADEGFRIKNTLASYIHVHFGSNPNIAKRFAG